MAQDPTTCEAQTSDKNLFQEPLTYKLLWDAMGEEEKGKSRTKCAEASRQFSLAIACPSAFVASCVVALFSAAGARMSLQAASQLPKVKP